MPNLRLQASTGPPAWLGWLSLSSPSLVQGGSQANRTGVQWTSCLELPLLVASHTLSGPPSHGHKCRLWPLLG